MTTESLWYKDAVIYELHVRAFFDSTNDGVGDFAGLTSKLDYLHDLGVTCLWLLPFYPSPLKDDGYDIANYEGIHPSYGTMKDFKTFLREAHARGLKVVTELVINHTSDQHPWFQAARKAPPGSSKRDYYVWSDTNHKYEGVRIIFTDTEHSNWTWDPEAKAYYWHRFFRHQPDLNFDNPRVRRAVLKTMKYWLDMGVDGLRLDAIPYLIEREGTNCENLPETHAIIKDIRRELDRHYSDRMLLAEANQWPADVREYFGDGDECHMSFNFPLMPRIFMSLQLEDRFPIVEVIRQTPEIPESCQWAIFLRNHDELTLEMVTDEERDYMYQAYAADPQMRVNIGIRRRLAPLMENNRERIELLYGMLFSLPGTPVIYYGDEIGMGDNIYLGDRNGVRTPMQWTGDRNAGFSRADPARLFAPPIMDAVYGYQALNVEAQQRSPSSLLNWVKRMIGVRKQHQTFGRGSVEFLEPVNRKVLAFVRRHQDETILVVANLSRAVQGVSLDLSRFAGLFPVELRDRTEFPRIGTQPYFLSLAPYGFFWFRLQPSPSAIDVEQTPALLGPEQALLASGEWHTLFDGHVRRLIERDYLAPFLSRQRWFPGKARTIASARIADWGQLTRGREPSFLLLVDVTYVDGGRERYFVPVATAGGSKAIGVVQDTPELVIAHITGARKGVLHGHLELDMAEAFLSAIDRHAEVEMHTGRATFVTTSALAALKGDEPSGALPARRVSGEQSNTSLIFGDRLILKLFRRLEPGPNPEYELGYHLTERVGFKRVPPLAGGMTYTAPGDTEATSLAVLHGLVEHQSTGWDHALAGAKRLYDLSLAKAHLPDPALMRATSLVALSDATVPPLVLDTIGGYLATAALLGTRSAELHQALATPSGDPTIDPVPFSADGRRATAEAMREHARHVLDMLENQRHQVPPELVGATEQVLDNRDRLVARVGAIADVEAEVDAIRIHGDYHLGQVLMHKTDFVILDFEGEPAKPLAERRQRQLAMKDVAGMLRSFSYAVYAELFDYTTNRPRDFERLEPWTRVAQLWVSAVFLRSYRVSTAGARFQPADGAVFDALLGSFLIDKALYELLYELNNRPGWLRIPLLGLVNLIEGHEAR